MVKKIVPVMMLLISLLLPVSRVHSSAGFDGEFDRLLPDNGELEGWKKDGEMISYEADDLWEYINGSAERFLEYDFEKVLAQHYLDDAGKEIKVEIYAHGSALEAFGIYSRFRSSESEIYDIGNESFGDEYTLHFWKGRFYVRVLAYDEGSGSIKGFARLVAEKIKKAGSVPGEVKLLELDGLIEKSINYVAKGVLGSGKLPPAFVAEYDIEGDSGKIFLFSLEDEIASSRIFDWYKETGSQPRMMDVKEPGAISAEGELPYRGRVVLFSYGRMAGIITGYKNNPAIADDLSMKMLENVISFVRGEDSR